MEKVLEELCTIKKSEYVFREKTIIWKDINNNEYKFYISVILETYGWNRFDYSAFDYGDLPINKDIEVIVYTCTMKSKKFMIQQNKFIIDPLVYYPQYDVLKIKLKDVF